MERACDWATQSLRFWRDYVECRAATFDAERVRATLDPTRRRANDRVRWQDGGTSPKGTALVVSSDVPDADYWGWTMHTRWWLDSGAFDERSTSINHAQAHVDTDGRYRVIHASDPGTANWIDITDHPSGLLVYRYVGARTRPVPEAELVTVDDVRSRVPRRSPERDTRDRPARRLRRRRIAVEAR